MTSDIAPGDGGSHHLVSASGSDDRLPENRDGLEPVVPATSNAAFAGVTAVTGFVALFGAVVIADGADRLLLGGFAFFLLYDVAREIRAPGYIERRTALADEPAGPWLVGVGVFVLLNAIGLGLLLDRTNDGLVRFLVFAVVVAASYGIGLLVRSAVSRLPRYQAAADHK